MGEFGIITRIIKKIIIIIIRIERYSEWLISEMSLSMVYFYSSLLDNNKDVFKIMLEKNVI